MKWPHNERAIRNLISNATRKFLNFTVKMFNFHIKKTRQVYSVSLDVYFFDIVYEAYTILQILRPVFVLYDQMNAVLKYLRFPRTSSFKIKIAGSNFVENGEKITLTE